jgi:hypothetical protein
MEIHPRSIADMDLVVIYNYVVCMEIVLKW